MENQSFYSFAGFAGILSAILYIVSIIGMQAYLASNLDDMAAFTQNMIDSQFMMLLYGWPGLVATLLIFPLVLVIHKLNVAYSLFSRTIFLITVTGLSFIIVGYLFHLALTYFHAPVYQALDLIQQRAFDPVIHTTIGLQDMFWLSGDLFSFLGISVLLLLGVREKVFPGWFYFVVIIASLFAAVGSFGFIPAFKQIPALCLIFIGGFSAFAIWEIIAGLLLIRLAKS